MSEAKAKPEAETVRIVIEYAPKDGRITIFCNMQDEVLVTGMLDVAKDRMRANFRLEEMKAMRKQAENGIVKPDGAPILGVQ